MTAPTAITEQRAVLYACELAVLRALELAGKRGRTRRDRSPLQQVPAHEQHTRLRLASCPEDCDRYLAGAWDQLRLVLPPGRIGRLVAALDWYTRQLIVTRQPHARAELARVLTVVFENGMPVTDGG